MSEVCFMFGFKGGKEMRKRSCGSCGKKWECLEVKKGFNVCVKWKRRTYQEILEGCGKRKVL